MHVFKNIFFLFLFLASLYGEEMRIEEKIGQLLIVHFRGDSLNKEARQYIDALHVGGFIFYEWANGLHSPEQVASLAGGLQQYARTKENPPLFLSIDQEGGAITRLRNGFTYFPGNYALGLEGDLFLAESAAHLLGLELYAVGINLNFAPVVDLLSNGENPVIGVRSFGKDPELVTRMAEVTLSGLSAAGVIPVLKHFPGYGDALQDPHLTLPEVTKTKEELLHSDLIPYLRLSAKTPMIMTSHLYLPLIDSDHMVTTSSEILNGLLRKEMGFEGVLVTDSLAMNGALEGTSIEELALNAFLAGHDLLLLGGKELNKEQQTSELSFEDVKRIHHYFVQAVKDGVITRERLELSLQRIQKVKDTLTLRTPDSKKVKTPLHEVFAKKIASSCVTPFKNQLFPLKYINACKTLLVYPDCCGPEIEQSKWAQLGSFQKRVSYRYLAPTQEEFLQAKEGMEWADLIIVCSYNGWKYPRQQNFIKLFEDKPVLFLPLRDPKDASILPCASFVAFPYSSSPFSLDALLDIEWEYPLHKEEIAAVKDLLFENELGCNWDHLLFWSPHESFPSLGLGHFIWAPSKAKILFEEGFPKFIKFLDKRGFELPDWIKSAKGCPWENRESFLSAKDSPRMQDLKDILLHTLSLQAEFACERLDHTIEKMLSHTEKMYVLQNFFRMIKEPKGRLALIDYLNFKGSGLNQEERYHGEGWGLYQVLCDMQRGSPIEEFSCAAERVLKNRVKNAPNEERFLRGWLLRVSRYKLFNESAHTE